MVSHFIIMSSSYSEGTRIALDIKEDKELNTEYISEIIKGIKNSCGDDTPISTHSIWAETGAWESVIKADLFFETVKVVDSVEEFVMKINRDRTLKGTDIAKYILSKISCSHLKLEKLCYLCYADYICKTKKRLFEDRIYAFRYGPVIDSVYEKYKEYGSTVIEKKEEMKMPWKSRILFAEDGIEKVQSIDTILEEYGYSSAIDLVQLTHCKGSPWERTYKGDMYGEIPDEEIIKSHCNE